MQTETSREAQSSFVRAATKGVESCHRTSVPRSAFCWRREQLVAAGRVAPVPRLTTHRDLALACDLGATREQCPLVPIAPRQWLRDGMRGTDSP